MQIRNILQYSIIYFTLLINLHSAKPLVEVISADSLFSKNNPNYQLLMGLYDIYKTKQADIVMLGNSITHGAAWSELLNRTNVVDRGIPADIVAGFLNRMEYIYKLHPKICFIMGGVNDIYSWIPVETILNNYLEIINGLRARNIKVVIQSTLYTSKNYGKEWLAANKPDLNIVEYNIGRNREIGRLNQLLSNYAKSNGIDFIDLNSKMSLNNFLNEELTWDGVHLNAAGYKIWSDEVDSVLKKYEL